MSMFENRCFHPEDDNDNTVRRQGIFSINRNNNNNKSNNGWQQMDGWCNMSPCYSGIPIGISMPHFLNSHYRQQDVDGVKPDLVKHLGYLDIEPQIGVPTGGLIGIQINIKLSPITQVSDMAKLPNVLLPMFWIKEVSES